MIVCIVIMQCTAFITKCRAVEQNSHNVHGSYPYQLNFKLLSEARKSRHMTDNARIARSLVRNRFVEMWVLYTVWLSSGRVLLRSMLDSLLNDDQFSDARW